MSRLFRVALNSAFFLSMRRLAATSDICCITRITNSSLLKGFVRKSLAPTWKPCTRSEGVFRAVRKIMGISLVASSFFRITAVSKPLISGIITSSRIRSGCSVLAISIQVVPLLAVQTWNFSFVRSIFNNNTLLTTSSTISILYSLLFILDSRVSPTSIIIGSVINIAAKIMQ